MGVDLSIFRDALPYRSFTEADWASVAGAFRQVDVSASTVVFREGDAGDGFYLVRSGHVKIRRMVSSEGLPGPQEQLLTVLDAGQLFGEMALVEGDTRSADAVSDEGAVLYRLSRAEFEHLKNEAPSTAQKLQDLLVTTLCGRLRSANKSFEVAKLSKSTRAERAVKSAGVDLSIFRDASPYRAFQDADWKVLAEAIRKVDVPEDSVLFREGDPGDGFYLVRSGHIRIRRMVSVEGGKDLKEQLLTVLNAGQLFGEMALVDQVARSADATSDEGAELYHLTGTGFERLKKEAPSTALKIQDLLVTTLCERLRAANKNFEVIKFWLS
jgi:CRP-like cAMP-binding protein